MWSVALFVDLMRLQQDQCLGSDSRLDLFLDGIPTMIYLYIYMVPSSVSPPPPPHGLGPQVVAPIPFYLQAIGSISEVQRRIC